MKTIKIKEVVLVDLIRYSNALLNMVDTMTDDTVFDEGVQSPELKRSIKNLESSLIVAQTYL